MAYQTPRTWAAGERPTAAQFNQDIRDNQLAAFPLSVGAWTTYTPTLTQSGSVTKTVTRATYQRIGRWITGQFSVSATGAGTTANAVAIGLPVAAAVSSGVVVGNAFIYDASTVLRYSGTLELATATTAVLVGDWSGDQAWGVTPNLALASGDLFRGVFQFEAAS